MVEFLAGERKHVSVMFADIVGSTSMVAGHDPEDAERSLTSVLVVLEDAIKRYGGTVGQQLGDGFLAVFGAPCALEDHALRACMAAEDIRAAALAPGSGFSVRIGIASGEIIAHVVEHGMWSDYRTVGECVNLAARLQQRADPNSVLLSGDTVELVPSGLSTRAVASLTLSLNTGPRPVHELCAVRAARRTAVDLMSGTVGPFVGRCAEVETLVGAYKAAVRGGGGVVPVLVSGEAGVGKSRLVSESLRRLRDQEHTLVLCGQAPVRRVGAPDDLEHIAASLVPLAGGGHELCVEAERVGGPLAGAVVSELLGLPAGERKWQVLQPAERLTASIDALAALVVALSERRPIIAVFEDVHWAGASVRHLMEALARERGKAARVLLVGTTRPEGHFAWAPDIAGLVVHVDALQASSARDYLDRRLGVDPSIAGVKDLLILRSQGVPLYLEESLRALESAGTLIGAPGNVRLGAASDRLDLPASVRDLLAARIDALPEDLRRTLLSAAVVGPTFDISFLQGQESCPLEVLSRRFVELERTGFVAPLDRGVQLEYRFRHGLIQEVAYATITRSDRRVMHARVLKAVRERRRAAVAGCIELLAHHAFHGECWPEAYVFGRVAGQRAERRSKLEEAGRHYRNALFAVERMPAGRRRDKREIDLCFGIARVLLPRGLSGIDEYLVRALELAKGAGDRLRIARVSSLYGAYEWVHGRVNRAIRLGREGLAAVAQTGDLDVRLALAVRLGGALVEKGAYAEARSVLEHGLRETRSEQRFATYGTNLVGLVAFSSLLTRCYAELGCRELAVEAGQAGIVCAEESDHAFSKLYANASAGSALLLLRAPERGAQLLQAALELSDRIGGRLHWAFIMANLGYAHVLLGESAQGMALIERSLAPSFHGNVKVYREDFVRLLRADAFLRLGRPVEALEEARRSSHLAACGGRLGHLARASYVHAKAAWTAGQFDTSAALALSRASRLAHRLSMRVLGERCADGVVRFRA